jgi:DNA invertase Pin-like site-specific DNA recombinase
MVYGYVRVSSLGQNIARQVSEMENYCIKKRCLFVDVESGKDFKRPKYQQLKCKIKKGDLLIIQSIDRLGRNYEMIIQEWFFLTKVVGADILVIDMPLLNTQDGDSNLMGRFISDVVLQILSFVAQHERESIRQRQAEGIRLAKLRGVRFGRKPINLSPKLVVCLDEYSKNNLDYKQVIGKLQISKSTYYKLIKQYKNLTNK